MKKAMQALKDAKEQDLGDLQDALDKLQSAMEESEMLEGSIEDQEKLEGELADNAEHECPT